VAGTVLALVATAGLALTPPPAPTVAPSSAALDAVSAARFRRDVEFLADDSLEGRRAGTEGYDAAARYAAAELQKLGLEPAGDDDTFFQAVPLIESEVVESRLALRRGRRTKSLKWRDGFLTRGDPRRASTRVSGPLVFAGYGISAPELGHDDYAGGDVRGKVVALLPGAPAALPDEEQAHFASRAGKLREAARRGALAVVELSLSDSDGRRFRGLASHARGETTTWIGPGGSPYDEDAPLPAAILGPKGVEALLDLAPPDARSRLAVPPPGPGEPVELGVVGELEIRSEHRRLDSRNVIARLRGSDPDLSAEHVVLTAHLDHEGVGRERGGDSIYNGAYDNAAGAAVVLEAARALVRAHPAPRRSILFVLVTAEESGLLGSSYFATYPTVPRDRIVADINVDMPLFLFPIAEVIAFGSEASSLGDVIAAAAARQGLGVGADPVPEQHLFIRSDQYSFVRRGVPAVFLMTGTASTDPTVDGAALWREFLQSYYHTPADDLGRPMDLPSAERFIRFVVDAGWTVAQSEDPPRWRDDTYFGRLFGSRRAN